MYLYFKNIKYIGMVDTNSTESEDSSFNTEYVMCILSMIIFVILLACCMISYIWYILTKSSAVPRVSIISTQTMTNSNAYSLENDDIGSMYTNIGSN